MKTIMEYFDQLDINFESDSSSDSSPSLSSDSEVEQYATHRSKQPKSKTSQQKQPVKNAKAKEHTQRMKPSTDAPRVLSPVLKYKSSSNLKLDGGEEQSSESSSSNATVGKIDSYNEVAKLYPVYTQPWIHKTEYAAVIEKVAKYILSLTDVSRFFNSDDGPNLTGMTNPSELALTLLENHKIDCILIRGIEEVTYSVLQVNPQWSEELKARFKHQHEVHKENLRLLDLAAKDSK